MEHKWHKPDPYRNIAYNKTDPSPRSTNYPGVLFLGGLASDMEGTKARFLEGLALELGFSYIRSKNLLTPMMIHGTWNGTVLTILYVLQMNGVDIQHLLHTGEL